MSSNIPWTALAENQDAPEIVLNEMSGLLDAALTENYVVDVTGGSVTVTALQSVAAVLLITGATTAGRVITLSVVKRRLDVFSQSTNTFPVTLKVGSTEIELDPDKAVSIYTDGTTNGLIVLTASVEDSGGSGLPTGGTAGQFLRKNSGTDGDASFASLDVAISIFLAGLMDDAETLFRYVVPFAFLLPSGAAASFLKAEVAATGSTTLTLKKNGSSFATVVVSASGTDGVFTQASNATFATGDVLTVHAPATADATLANTAMTILGTRS